MKQHLKAIIKQIVAEEIQKEGKGYLRGAALAGLLALGAGKMADKARTDSTTQTQQTDTVQSLAQFAISDLKKDFEDMSESSQTKVVEQIQAIEDFQGSEDELFDKLRVLAVRVQRAGLVSSKVSEYLDRYFKLKAARAAR